MTDEDVYAAVAVQLRRAGIDAISTPDLGRRGADDVSQLQWAADTGRVLVTFNVTDFARLHHRWHDERRRHAGIVVSSQRSIGDMVRRLHRLCEGLTAEQMVDRLEYLGNW